MVKEFLNEVRKMPAEVKAAEARLAQIRAEAVLLKSPKLGDKVQTSTQNGLEAIVSQIEEQEKEVIDRWGKLLEMRRRADMLIDLLQDSTQRAVLSEYYVHGYTWKAVADDLYYTPRAVQYIGRKALDFLEAQPEAKVFVVFRT